MSVDARRFNSAQRVALYMAADGRCSLCQEELTPGWHADHMTPHSRGGATDVVNGQALCAACNLQKGSKHIMPPSLSEWQQEALRKFRALTDDFLTVASPGSGKTRFAVAAARDQIDRAGFDNIIVVVPTKHLRHQWAAAATPFGVHLDSNFENRDGAVAGDYTGVVITYQAVGSQPQLYRRLASPRTLVVLDEVHHAGNDARWGSALRIAFEGAGRRLLLSGTPSRTDGTEIPFVTYDDQGLFVEDYLYDYGLALRDHRVDDQGRRVPVVRPVDFNVLDGTTRWISASAHKASIDLSEANDRQMANALQSALEPSGDWIPSALKAADEALQVKRQTMPDAGGLLIAADQFRARKYARTLEQVSGEKPALAISDLPEASKTITDFAQDRSRWLVAVAMVSEGVDIPRLAVGVYATQTRTDLFFRQVIGRIVRSRGVGDVGRATMFIPAVEPLVRYAAEIEHTARVALADKEASEARQSSDLDGDWIEPTILGAGEAQFMGTITGGEAYTEAELASAQSLLEGGGFPGNVEPVTMAKFMREVVGIYPDTGEPTATEPSSVPLSEQKRQARQDIKKLVGKVAYHCYDGHTSADEVRYDLRREFPPIGECSLDQLNQQIKVLAECLSTGRRVA